MGYTTELLTAAACLPGALQEVHSTGSQDSNRELRMALRSSATTSFLLCRCNAPLQTMVAGIPKGGLGTASYAASKSSSAVAKGQGDQRVQQL